MSLDRFENFGYMCAYESFMAFSFDEDDIATEGIGEKFKSAIDTAKRVILGLLKKIREGIQNAIRAIQRKFNDKTLRVGISKQAYANHKALLADMGKIVSLIEDIPPVSKLAVAGASAGGDHDAARRSDINSKLTYINSEVAKLYRDMKEMTGGNANVRVDDENERVTFDPHEFVKSANDLADRVHRVEATFANTVFNGNNEGLLKSVHADSDIDKDTVQSIMNTTSLYVSQCQKIVAMASSASSLLLSDLAYMTKAINNVREGKDVTDGMD